MTKALSVLLFAIVASASQAAIGIGVIGGGGSGEPITATVYSTDVVTFSGTASNGADSVEIEITTAGDEHVATLTASPDVFGAFSANWYPPVDQTYTVTATTFLDGIEQSTETVAFVSAVRPDAAGKITGGGWINMGAGKDTMGFVAQVLGNGTVKGNWEFQDHGGSINFKSTSLDWVYAPDCHEGFFSGWCKWNGSGNYRFFVHVTDSGEPGINDLVEFNVFDPVSGALLASYSRTLNHGNVQIHCN